MRCLKSFYFVLLFSSACWADIEADWSYVESRLKKAHFGKSYIAALKKNYDKNDFEKVITLNVLLFLKTSDYHGTQVVESSAEDVQVFIADQVKTLELAEKNFGVPKNIIASLLWMESRHGKTYGSHHVPSVFLHLLQSERKDVLQLLQDKATEFAPVVTKKQRREITKRTKRKADWALQELKALEIIHKKNPEKLTSLTGSFSGAFGMPQFLPSSYKKWACTPRKNAVPDLFIADDAIFSVGHYLKKHGWRQKRKKSHVKSLMKYNNSRDYAEAIIKLAQIIDG